MGSSPKARFSWNPSTSMLYTHALPRGDGRSPRAARSSSTPAGTQAARRQDKFVVREPELGGADLRGATSTSRWKRSSSTAFARRSSHIWSEDLYVVNAFAGADPEHRLALRVITDSPWHALFAQDAVHRAEEEELREHRAGGAGPPRAGRRGRSRRSTARAASTFVVLHPGARPRSSSAAPYYAGEIKKSIFTLMNDRLPLEGVLPMHCSANVGDEGRVRVFFGLSGTGKTTLSADPERHLIGDDEHGWGDEGVFNFEGGCYAKVIRLSAEAEPQIFRTTHTFGTVLENVVDGRARRARPGRRLEDREHPRRLQARADRERAADEAGGPPERGRLPDGGRFGILPPIARLSREQAMFYFLSGYTAKLAGTEIGVTEPQPTFSACFGAPFLPQPPTVYARDARREARRARRRPYGSSTRAGRAGPTARASGCRSRRRARCSARRSERGLDDVDYRIDPIFGFEVPARGAGCRLAAARPALDLARPACLRRARRRSSPTMFRENFEQFARPAGGLAAAGPARSGRRASRLVRIASDLAVDAKHDVLSSGPAAPGCARPSRPSTRAPTSRSSPRSTRCAATPAPPRAGSTRRSGTRPRTAPRSTRSTPSRARTTSATRTRSRSSATRRPADVYQLEHWGAVFSRTEDGRIAQRPFGAAGEPRTAYAADITGHVLIQVLYEQVMKRDILVYEEYFAWQLVVDDDRCQGVICWDLLNGGLKTIGAKTVILATGGAGRLYVGTTNAYACTGDGMAMALARSACRSRTWR